MDRFSPVAPAYIRVLVLPVGQIERSRFLNFVGRLQNEAWMIKLADIQQYIDDDDDLLLSPKSFPQGSILYNYSTSAPNPQQEQLSPFELFREPLLVLGVVDRHSDQDGLIGAEELGKAAEYLRECHSRVVYRQLLILKERGGLSEVAADSAIRIHFSDEPNEPALKQAICELSAQFLKELSTYTQAMQASPSVQTPGQTARSLQRTSSQREQEKRPQSGHSTPTKSRDPSTPIEGSKAPPFDHASPPATSFDQMASANVSRSDSRASNKSKHVRRASSQDRVPVQGFGSGTSQDKLKQRGKARVGIVTGSIYLAAGQWSEALRILVEHTNKARILADHIWHGKGLELIIVCLMLQAWAGLEFQIPSICYPITDKASASQQRFSVNLPSDFNPSDASRTASIRRLSTSLPDLLKLVLSLYRSVEGSLELPFVSISESTIRFTKLLTVLYNAGGELDHSTLDRLITSSVKDDVASKPVARSPAKASIADMLSHAHPTNDDQVQIADHVAILSGIATIYAILQMPRKRANILTDLVAKLTLALNQARKRGAAEMGIHPAASLSAEAGADAILAITEDSEGVNKIMAEIAEIYGIDLPKSASEEIVPAFRPAFGNDNLKVRVLRDLGAFCEAIPDPHGILKMTTAVLSTFGPNGTVDPETVRNTRVLSKDDQARLTTTISRTIGVSKRLGLKDVAAVYWDRFLVRNVEFLPPDPAEDIIDRPKIRQPKDDGTTRLNPLLYDPNASRPGTAPEATKTHVLVQGETAVCHITLQNPYEVPLEIESISLVAEGVEIEASRHRITLGPLRLQHVRLPLVPHEVGEWKITGVRVKIAGCVEEVFSITSKTWAAPSDTLIKNIGQSGRPSMARADVNAPRPEYTTVAATVIEAQPLLVLEDDSSLEEDFSSDSSSDKDRLSESNVMILHGERREVSMTLRNTSSIALSIFGISTTSNENIILASVSNDDGSHTTIYSASDGINRAVAVEPDKRVTFRFTLVGNIDNYGTVQSFFYSRAQDGGHYARQLEVPLGVTVNAALEAQHVSIAPVPMNHQYCSFSFDLRNAWPRPLSFAIQLGYTFEGCEDFRIWQSPPHEEGTLAPGEIRRFLLKLPRYLFDWPNHSKEAMDCVRKALEYFRVKWSGEGRAGLVDFGQVVFTPEDVEAFAMSYIEIESYFIAAHTSRWGVESWSKTKPRVKVGSFVTLRVKVKSKESGPLLVQVHIHDSADGAQEERKISVVGSQFKVLRPPPSGTKDIVDFEICPMLTGSVELDITVKGISEDAKNKRVARNAMTLTVV